MAIQCNFIKSPVPGTERFSNTRGFAPSYNSIGNSRMRLRRTVEEPFDCEEVLPQDRNFTYVPV